MFTVPAGIKGYFALPNLYSWLLFEFGDLVLKIDFAIYRKYWETA